MFVMILRIHIFMGHDPFMHCWIRFSQIQKFYHNCHTEDLAWAMVVQKFEILDFADSGLDVQEKKALTVSE